MKRKELRIERFLGEMQAVIPWGSLCEEIRPFYYAREGGRARHDLLLMLKVHFLQLWNNLSDPMMEEALYDRLSFQEFLGFDCFGGEIPDESSICRFRHLLEANALSERILSSVNAHLAEHGLVLQRGTIVDATLISAPVSKKNKSGERDPEMSSTKKNNKWYFGAKGHIGVQAEGRPIVHTTRFTTAKAADITELENLQHGNEKALFGDSAYLRRADKQRARESGLYYGISDRGTRRRLLSSNQQKKNRKHSRLRAKVEHPFRVIKHLWGHNRMRYKGLTKNASRFTTLCALSNIFLCRKELAMAAI